ncbi:hypothetical protein C8T65DRAFT_671248 [Cerioporus squamosus]|nr:hypothetical protein C8T65DRAFT_671248 [Cerioporus squamosus]
MLQHSQRPPIPLAAPPIVVDMSDTIAIAPMPHYYAAIQMDPVAMAKDLGLDDTAVAEAEVLAKEVKKYLVYMFQLAELPLPTSRWCRYDIKPIGTTLRPADDSRGFTPDMVIPIAENTAYTGERKPVRPTPSFPFHNCYHWIKNDMTVRVRVQKGGVDHAGAVSLPLEEDFALNKGFRADYKRIRAFLRQKRAAAAQEPPRTTSADSSGHTASMPATVPPSKAQPRNDVDSVRPDELSETYRRMAEESGVTTSTPPESDAASSARSVQATGRSAWSSCSSDSEDSTSSSSSSLPSSVPSIDSLATADLFGWDPDPANGLIPLVDAWLDIANHFPGEESIPSPTGLEEEARAIRSIIKRGVARRALAEKAKAAARSSQDDLLPEVSDVGARTRPDEHRGALSSHTQRYGCLTWRCR